MAAAESSVVWLEEVDNTDVATVGGKGASLGEMMNAELPVPRGYAVTAQAFRRFLDETGIGPELFSILDSIDVDDNKSLQGGAKKAKNLVLRTEMPPEIREEIVKRYKELSEREGEEVFVAVRSSATAEDLPEASFAGQQETFLNVKGPDAVVESVQKCWASLYGARAIYYREKQGFEHETVNLSAIVQKMVNAEEAGVMFTSHPSTGEKQVIIEAAWGLGESVVSGAVSPDNYVIDRATKKITSKIISTKNTMIIKDPKTGETSTIDVPEDKKNVQVLTEDEIMKLVNLAEILEAHYGIPQDVEWGVEAGKIYMLQSRPITTITERAPPTEAEAAGNLILEGLGASPGAAYGPVKIIKSAEELDKVKEGDILVTVMTTPDMVPAMRRANAIVTDEGGLTCHAAIVSRELGTPAVVGTRQASKTLKDGQVVTVDGERGQIYEGRLERAKPKEELMAAAMPAVTAAKPITVTEVKVNVSIPEAAQRAAATQADGVGLLRIEHMILGLNKHPSLFIKKGREDEYIDELVNGIATVADAFYPKPVWVRTIDAPTDEFRAMEGGEHEPIEHNPMLGYRGIRRDLDDIPHFKLEIEAFKRLLERGYDNLGLMLPMVQHPSELRRAKEIMRQEGLDIDTLDIGIMVEVPAAAVIIEDFLKEGLDFISFGTNDLTQYTLAVDRNNENVAGIYNEMHPAVLKLIEFTIAKCREYGVQSSICGQAGSYPPMVKKLVEFGISSVSSNIDAVANIREVVSREEQRIMLEAVRKSR